MRTCSRSASQADPEPPDSFAPLQEVVDWIRANGGLPYLAHTYWSGLRTEQWERCEGCSGSRSGTPGCELEIGRGDSSIHWDEALERGAALQGARDRRLAPPRLRQRLRVDDGARRGALAGGGARGAARRQLLRLDRPDDRERRGRRQRGRRALVARRRASRSSARAIAARARTPAGSAIRTRRRSSSATPRASSRPCRLEKPPLAPVRTCRGVRHRGHAAPGRIRCGRARSGRRAARLAPSSTCS